MGALGAGSRHVPSATFASPFLVALTADLCPTAVLLQGRHDAAPELPTAQESFVDQYYGTT